MMLIIGIVLVAGALAAGSFAVLAAPVSRLPKARRQSGTPSDGLVAAVGDGLTALIDRSLRARGWLPFSAVEVELAGLSTTPAALATTVLLAAFTVVIVVTVLSNIVVGLLVALLVPVVVKVVLSHRTSQRRAMFADQLEQTLQILSSGLRAGHSMPHAIDATSREADEPMGPELVRIVNENRLGRDLVEAMKQTAVRMDNDDFAWVADAVAIQRDTGGNLSAIIDRVAETIRIRSEIRAQVHALSAEGRISALVLMALPLVVAGMYTLLNPSYMSLLVTERIGLILLSGCAVLYVISVFWLRAIVKVELMLILGILLICMALGAMLSALGIVGVSTKPVRRRLQSRLMQGAESRAGRTLFADGEGVGWARFVVPRPTVARVDRQLQLAGRPGGWTVRRFVAVKAASTVLSIIVSLLVVGSELKPLTAVLAGLLVFIGFKAPDVVLQRRSADRQSAIRKAMPDVLDQTTVSIESGLSMEGALARVSESTQSALSDEFSRTLQDMRVGMSRKDAYEALAQRTEVDDLKHFVKSILQADEFGVSVAKVVATQAADIRIKRRFEAEARALQIPVKMLFPLLICLFPALFVVVLTPAFLNLSDTFATR